jgi:hypothetical protein
MTRKAKAAAPASKRKRASKPKRAPKRKAAKRQHAKRKRSSAPRRRGGPPKPGRGFKFEVARVKLNRQGYDARGAYYGANSGGLKLYSVRVIDRATDLYTQTNVRARTAAEAKAEVMAGMMRAIDSSPAPKHLHAPKPKHAHARPAFSGPSLGFSTVSPHRGERSFSEQSGDLAGQIARVTRAARAASEAGNYLEAARLGEQAEALYARYERGGGMH